jgi:hypothetical protein
LGLALAGAKGAATNSTGGPTSTWDISNTTGKYLNVDTNDIAVIGFRERDGHEKFETPLKDLSAMPIEDLIDGGSSPLFPFDHLVPAWRSGLVDNYGLGAQNNASS